MLALYYTAKDEDCTPASYAFGDNIPLQSQYEINFYVKVIGKEHEQEQREAAEHSADMQ